MFCVKALRASVKQKFCQGAPRAKSGQHFLLHPAWLKNVPYEAEPQG